MLQPTGGQAQNISIFFLIVALLHRKRAGIYRFTVPFPFIVVSRRSALLRGYTASIAWTNPQANISPGSTCELHISCALAPSRSLHSSDLAE